MEIELSRLVDALPGLVWTARPDGHADFLNQRWREYTGLHDEQAYGFAWLDAIHPEDLQELVERWQSALESGEPREIEARLRRHDGVYRWFAFRASPIVDAAGQIVKWCGINTDIEDRRRAEHAQRESDRRFASIVDGLPAVVTLMTADGELEHANGHMLEYFGRTLEELKSRPVGYSFHPTDRPEVLARWRHSVQTGDPYDFEARLRRADGVYRWFHTVGFPLRDAGGRISLWYLLQTDIDDRKRAEILLDGEKQLIEMVARGRSMTEILEALCHLVERTIDGCFCSVVLVNSRATHLAQGVAPSLPATFLGAISGRPVNVDSGPNAMAIFLNEQVIATDLRAEARWPTYDWCATALAHGLRACWSTPFSSSAGNVFGAFAIYFDEPKVPTPFHQGLIDRFAHIASVTVERAHSDAKLKRNETFLAEAQRLSRTGSWAWRVTTGEIMWSQQTYRIFELDPALPVTFELIASRVHPDDLPMLYELMARAQGDGTDFEYEHRLRMPDRSVKHLRMVAHGTRDDDGHREFIGAVMDVTERRLSDDALNKVRSELAHVARVSSLGILTASIAHEVNQPLAAIKTNAGTCLRMLAPDPANIPGAREIARRIVQDANRASSVIARLRALFAEKDATSESIDVNAITREVIVLSRLELQRSGVLLQTDFDDDLPLAVGDRVQLQQVILNLLINALDAMNGASAGPRDVVLRSGRADASNVFVEVRDSGPGFDPANLDRLFHSFYTTKPGGMGMGLSISRSIVEAHGGRLSALPNEPRGAVFRFTVPIHDRKSSAP